MRMEFKLSGREKLIFLSEKRMRLFITALPLAYLCGTIYILVKLWHCIGKPCRCFGTLAPTPLPLWIRIAAMALTAVVACSLFISIGIRNSQAPFWLMKLFHTIGAIWMLYMFYLILILIPTDIARVAIPYLKGAAWFASARVFCGASAIVAAVLIGGYINYINPKIVEMEIDLKSPDYTSFALTQCHNNSATQAANNNETSTYASELPTEIKIVAISDIHLGYGTGRWLTRRYIKKINAQKPDMVLIAGDLIDNSTKPVAHRQLHLELNKIEAPMGIYMTPGNHEYISGIAECKKLLAQTKVQLLQDSIITIPFHTALPDSQATTQKSHLPNKEDDTKYGPASQNETSDQGSDTPDGTSETPGGTSDTANQSCETSSGTNAANCKTYLQIIGRDDRSNRNRKSLEELLVQAVKGRENRFETSTNSSTGSTSMQISSDTTTNTAHRTTPACAAKNTSFTTSYTIVLDHQPYNLAHTDSLGIEIQISGHTHRGQIWPLNLLTDKLYEQSHGYRKWPHSHIWVSSGLSLWGPPFRIGTRSEIGVMKVRY